MGDKKPNNGEVHYLQSQNGNMFTSRYFDMSGEDDPTEFEPLREYVPSEVPWCSSALGTDFCVPGSHTVTDSEHTQTRRPTLSISGSGTRKA